MLKRFLQIVIFLFVMLVFGSAQAADVPPAPKVPIIEPAKMNSFGMLIDKDGLIIGMRNNKDRRANKYEFYYFGVSPEGDVTPYSVYKVYQNPDVTWPDFVQERLVEEEKDDSEIIAKSELAQNAILLYDDRIFFNGKELKSGDVANGGIVTLVDGKLYYDGQRIESGTVVNNGQIVQVIN